MPSFFTSFKCTSIQVNLLKKKDKLKYYYDHRL